LKRTYKFHRPKFVMYGIRLVNLYRAV